jgi:uncharacterized protein YlxW (UPF0749 family)
MGIGDVMEYTSGGSTWTAAIRRVISGLRPGARQRNRWSILVPVVALVAGLLFTTSARTSRGTSLREDRTPQLTSLIADRKRQVDAAAESEAQLRAAVDADTSTLGRTDATVASAQDKVNGLLGAAGLQAVHGPAITVELNDAPRRAGEALPNNATADDLVVHQQDVQAVVNALWAGGAEAMTIMGVRVISTSAVRCVGNTLLLQGRVYSPPFIITAIGDPQAMRQALDASPAVSVYRQAVSAFGLGYTVRTQSDVKLPAYDGSTSLQYAAAIP